MMISVDASKCISCGACADVCIFGSISLGENGPVQIRESCIKCGHCVAVCPRGALSHSECGVHSVGENRVERLLLSRHSCRNFLDTQVEDEKMIELLNVGRMAPSARNVQGISYIVIQNRAQLKALSESVITKYEEDIARDASAPALRKAMVERYRRDNIDTILWNAPSLIVARSNHKCEKLQRESAIFNLTYIHIYAQSLGLACCWAGALENAVFSGWTQTVSAMDMGDDIDKFCGALMVGYPRYLMYQVPERDELKIEWKK